MEVLCPLRGGVKSQFNIKSRDMLKDHVDLLLHGRVTLEPFSNQKENLMPSSDENGREQMACRATIFVMHYFDDFYVYIFNEFDTLIRSKGTQILRLIMTIDLN